MTEQTSRGQFVYELQYEMPGYWLVDQGSRLAGHVRKEGKVFTAYCLARSGEGKTRQAAIEDAVKQAGYDSAKHV